MDHQLPPSPYFFDIYCREDHQPSPEGESDSKTMYFLPHCCQSSSLDEIEFLLLKEKAQAENANSSSSSVIDDLSLAAERREAVTWMLSVQKYYSFSAVTAALSVNYLDRFLLIFPHGRDMPWAIHLVAVACTSLAAKVEETDVPLLCDFQVEKPKYVFEPKSIRRMELLLLSALQWSMNPVTPMSYLHGIISTTSFINLVQIDEFICLFESIFLALIVDSMFANFRPSILATGILVHVMKKLMYLSNRIDNLKKELCDVLKLSEERVEVCDEMIWSFLNDNKDKFYVISPHQMSS